ncbi:0ef49c8c-3646-46e0-9111-841a1184cd26 [Sclerotinia trifoliorum]|uniref:0ef49c8c-3646-46e0-9111-841a1184cd26 n=1 Tax=Sclerotinia trifoliorum TaxID=28548 RepID=A0A8H2W2A4_9HELO|nr:0ef49c8c-3646-46e0-9111-841a1184cd26 [Sclerotinia trifoliorum]
MGKWANRVLELRQNWSTEQRATPEELRLAFTIVGDCFNNVETRDIVIMLLTFKARKRGNIKDENKPRAEWDRRPDEVRRYESVIRLYYKSLIQNVG